jgi:hypothetical protein
VNVLLLLLLLLLQARRQQQLRPMEQRQVSVTKRVDKRRST